MIDRTVKSVLTVQLLLFMGVFLVQSHCPLKYTCTTYADCSTHSPDIPTHSCFPEPKMYCCPPPAKAPVTLENRFAVDPPEPQTPQGRQGRHGPQGPQGPQGPHGPQGRQGRQGPQGSLFPVENCGRERLTPRITQGKHADIGQFPWMALLAFKLNETSDQKDYLCGGTLINNRYILTAAHCVSGHIAGEPVSVRLGENDLNSEPDCMLSGDECSDPPLDVDLEEVIPHELYNTPFLKNDIALLRLKEVVSFTQYIKPICLPFSLNLTEDEDEDEGRKYFVAGWGKTDIGNDTQSKILMFTNMTGFSTLDCNDLQPSDVKPLDNTQMCAGGGGDLGDVCKGDSGGPLMFSITSNGFTFRTYQIGVVSFGSVICGDTSTPSVFTRVSSYRDWIQGNVM